MEVKTNFYLKEPKAILETLLLCRVYITRNNHFKISTRYKLHKQDWNNEKQEVRRSSPNYKEINLNLEQLSTEIKKIALNASLFNKKFTKEYLINNLTISNKKSTGQNIFFEVLDNWINNKKSTLSSSTIEKYTTLQMHLKRFETAYNYNINFESINENFYAKFIEYFIANNSHNQYISRTIRYVKSFMSYTFDKDLHNNKIYKKFKELKDNADEVFSLEAHELKAIIDLENLTQIQENARDLFLFLCFTGTRYSDLKNINNNTVKNNSISLITQKTKELVYIPVSKPLQNLLNKYAPNGTIKINVLSNQKMNEALKEIGELAQLNEETKRVRFAGANANEVIKAKHKFIATHTGKRTFITLAILLGIPDEMIQKITGNKDAATFKKYQKFSKEQLNEEIKKWNL